MMHWKYASVTLSSMPVSVSMAVQKNEPKSPRVSLTCSPWAYGSLGGTRILKRGSSSLLVFSLSSSSSSETAGEDSDEDEAEEYALFFVSFFFGASFFGARPAFDLVPVCFRVLSGSYRKIRRMIYKESMTSTYLRRPYVYLELVNPFLLFLW